MEKVIDNFSFKGKFIEKSSYGNGHINDTFLVIFKEGSILKKYILQRINKTIFLDPEKLMENVSNVTSFLKSKIEKQGGDIHRETLNIIPSKDGKPYYIDDDGEYWRAFEFIEGATSFDKVESLEDFYESGIALGKFHDLLKDYPAHSLHEIIKDFHNTKIRFKNLQDAIKEDSHKRASSAKCEIDFAKKRESEACILLDMLENGELPLRVTHNDTKLNNVMIDDKTHKALCMIDLDTVMPGLLVYDFGDSIRFGASTSSEDEEDLKKVSIDLDLFEAYLKGFMETSKESITENEVNMLAMGAKIITYEQGIRFLTDYLNGDVYYKTHRKDHNLDRCRVQFKLVLDMEEKWDEINALIKKYKN